MNKTMITTNNCNSSFDSHTLTQNRVGKIHSITPQASLLKKIIGQITDFITSIIEYLTVTACKWKEALSQNKIKIPEKEIDSIPKIDAQSSKASSVTEKLEERIGLRISTGLINLAKAALVTAVIYQTIATLHQKNILNKTVSYATTLVNAPACISYYGQPQTFEEAKTIFQCNNPWYSRSDSSKEWPETQKTFRKMSTLFHPDKIGRSDLQVIINKAREILRRAFTTESGQKDLHTYNCISAISVPITGLIDLPQAEKIFECASISSSQTCTSLENSANKILRQLAWIGNIHDQLSHAYTRICV